MHASLSDIGHRDLRHAARLFVRWQLDMLLLHQELESRAALQGERVQRDVIGSECRDLLHRVAHILGRLAGKPEDEVHVDVRDARLAQRVEHRDDVLRRVLVKSAVNNIKKFIFDRTGTPSEIHKSIIADIYIKCNIFLKKT